jgi:GTP-binding protein
METTWMMAAPLLIVVCLLGSTLNGNGNTGSRGGPLFALAWTSTLMPTHHTTSSISNSRIGTRNGIITTTPSRGAFSFRMTSSTSCRMGSESASASDGDNAAATTTTQQLTRPQRKALEREKKHNMNGAATNKDLKGKQKKNKNGKVQTMKLNGQNNSNKKVYKLHSTAVSELTATSTAEDVMRAIKRAQNNHDVHDLRNIETFLLDDSSACPTNFAYGYRGSLLARLAVAALHMNNHKLARIAIDVRRQEYSSSMLPLESAAVIRGLLRVHNVTDAMTLLEDELGVDHLMSQEYKEEDSVQVDGDAPVVLTTLTSDESHDLLIHRASALCSFASRHFYEMEPHMALKACDMLCQLGPVVAQSAPDLSAEQLNMPWLRILRGAAQCESQLRQESAQSPGTGDKQSTPNSINNDNTNNTNNPNNTRLPVNVVYGVLKAMLSGFPLVNDNGVYECLSNALVRRVVFVTGAVSMDTLPPSEGRGEAVFIGRSNVGKSSLVNMITNRKSLAYTSKRPGKTQQLNYFSVNDKPDLKRELRYGDDLGKQARDRDCFYIVDLPGFGYAQVPQEVRQEWSTLLESFLGQRKSLKVVFHLVDARHGTTSEDERIMRQMATILPTSSGNFKYVVVLTKADKNVKGKHASQGAVSETVISKIKETMQNAHLPPSIPLVLTSSETKLGRDDMWRYLRLAAEG